MEVKKDVDVLIKEVAACNTLTAEEDLAKQGRADVSEVSAWHANHHLVGLAQLL